MAKLEIGTAVDVYSVDGGGRPAVYQGPATIAGYARNRCYVVREATHGTTWHRHESMVRAAGQLMPADWTGEPMW
ncbi:hypothetical protein [Arthrobacter sp. A2-55]|uniref:hypothetical protein n=1 Tax=Arthrobacter sp. A2-55 TaxID=2897337 RepID=UPI0021CD3F58|nr:hypothetical protein [Arthrobacter sp. A2-55]MCU6479041.1 hypothetical protein [Arthrobacter sp. A2-55]